MPAFRGCSNNAAIFAVIKSSSRRADSKKSRRKSSSVGAAKPILRHQGAPCLAMNNLRLGLTDVTRDSHSHISSPSPQIANIDSPESFQVVYPIHSLRAPKPPTHTSSQRHLQASSSPNSSQSSQTSSIESIAIRGHDGSAGSRNCASRAQE